MTRFADKTVLITGAALGIGRRMARLATARGARVALWDVAERALAEAVDEAGPTARGYVCDVSSAEAVSERALEVTNDLGPVDVLINNAGIVSGKSFLELPESAIRATFGVNTLALFWTAKAFLPPMIARNSGHVVTVASAAGVIGVSRLSDYCASKWAAVGFDESLRVELRKTAPGVRTTVVCPYYIDTGMFDGVKTRFPMLLPILKEEVVAQRIIAAIEHDRPRLTLPRVVELVPLMRALPVPLFDAVASFLGINASMDQFTGHRT